MKKLALVALNLLLAGNAMAGSSINLPDVGVINPSPKEGSKLLVSLDRLVKNVTYVVTCQIENTRIEPIDMRFEAVSMPNGGNVNYGKFTMNGKELYYQQGSAVGGPNTFTVEIATGGSGNSLAMTNLDDTDTVTVRSCVATPRIGK